MHFTDIRLNTDVKKYKGLSKSKFYLNHLQFSNVLTDTTVILKDQMLNEKST